VRGLAANRSKASSTTSVTTNFGSEPATEATPPVMSELFSLCDEMFFLVFLVISYSVCEIITGLLFWRVVWHGM
jgi:hypothetical protein